MVLVRASRARYGAYPNRRARAHPTRTTSVAPWLRPAGAGPKLLGATRIYRSPDHVFVLASLKHEGAPFVVVVVVVVALPSCRERPVSPDHLMITC